MQVSPEQVISGAEWDALSRKDQERAVAERVIFARMTPENKVQIVQTLEHSGRVCAMVGDGSNDAAAIRAATVGIGVVAHGSDPARVAADLVLVDGRIESLLPAILEGRQLWQRVQAAVSVLLGGNAGEVAFAIIGSAITGTSPLNTRQLLLVNMLTDAGGARGQQAKRPGNAGNPRSRSTRAMACRRYPRGDHGGRGHRGLGDGGVHRLAAPRIHGGAGGAGGRSVGSNLGGLACLAGCAHRTGLTGRAGNLDQHPRRQPVARLHPPRPTRLGAGDSSRDCCDRRRRRAEPCADGSGQIGPAEPATTRDRCAFPRRVPRCAPRTSTTPTRHSTA